MSFDKTKQVSDEVASALSEILPSLSQLLRQYQIPETLKIDLVDLDQLPNMPDSLKTATCCFHNGRFRCACRSPYGMPLVGDISGLGLDPQQSEQFCVDVASKLSLILPRLTHSVQQANESFEVHILLDPTAVDLKETAVCQWVDDAAQGKILQCSRS